MNDKRLYHNVARKIAKLIDEGVYLPGSRLPAERDLAEQFNVSRVTVREAQIALQALGRIEIKTGSGVYVLDGKGIENGELPDASAFELTEARAIFEAEAAALAATRIDDETLAKLDAYIEIMANSGPEDEKGDVADRDFHKTIARASGNKAISHVIDVMWKMRTDLEPVSTVYKSVCSADFGARAGEHSQILTALKKRDAAGARQAMRDHFKRLLTSMLDVTEKRELEELRKKATESRQRYLKTANL
ncbi:MAG: FCD domain-containing protein [Pseudomonadales bacterium]|nr:FCD domain-containing protein [Pseudomonadales bacterium]